MMLINPIPPPSTLSLSHTHIRTYTHTQSPSSIFLSHTKVTAPCPCPSSSLTHTNFHTHTHSDCLHPFRRAVAELHNDDLDAVTGSALQDRVQLQSLFEDVAIADAVYEPSAREMAQACRLHQRDILAFEKESEHFQPAFARAVRPEKRQVLLVVRGTQTISDALTNLTGAL